VISEGLKVDRCSENGSSGSIKNSRDRAKNVAPSANNGNRVRKKRKKNGFVSRIVKIIVRSNSQKLTTSTKTKEERHNLTPNWLLIFFKWLNLPIAIFGLSAMAATIATTINSSHIDASNTKATKPVVVSKAANNPDERKVIEKLQRDEFIPETLQKHELLPLKAELQAIAAKYPSLKASVFCLELDRGLFVNWEGDVSFPAASTIKLPIMLALFQDIDAGKVRLDERLTIKPELIASGSGSIQYEKPGREYTMLEIVTKMIAISDNTATNVIIERLGGAEALNQRFVEWGLQSTVIRNSLPDLEGTNTTTAQDLSNVLLTIEHGKSVSLKSRDRMLGILEQTTTNTLLPPGLEKGSLIFHKTGDIGTVLGDTGIVDMLNGDRYVITVLAKRPHNDPQGKLLIQEISKAVYEQFKNRGQGIRG
jgi:beta-lactamase class A